MTNIWAVSKTNLKNIKVTYWITGILTLAMLT